MNLADILTLSCAVLLQLQGTVLELQLYERVYRENCKAHEFGMMPTCDVARSCRTYDQCRFNFYIA